MVCFHAGWWRGAHSATGGTQTKPLVTFSGSQHETRRPQQPCCHDCCDGHCLVEQVRCNESGSSFIDEVEWVLWGFEDIHAHQEWDWVCMCCGVVESLMIVKNGNGVKVGCWKKDDQREMSVHQRQVFVTYIGFGEGQTQDQWLISSVILDMLWNGRECMQSIWYYFRYIVSIHHMELLLFRPILPSLHREHHKLRHLWKQIYFRFPF